jgi:hypothetical protein
VEVLGLLPDTRGTGLVRDEACEPVRGGNVSERAAIACGAVIGAALGGLAGYLFLTEAGSRLRRRLEPQLGEVVRDLQALQQAVVQARDAASQGWRAAGTDGGDGASEWRDAGQTAPY